MTSIRGLKPHEWPADDQQAWAEARRPGGRLTRGGRAAHLKPVTRLDLARRYGLFLEFLARTGRMMPEASASALITPDNVTNYIADLQSRLCSVSVHGSIAKLRRIVELLDPHCDSTWLRDVEQELAWEMRPAPKFDRIIDSDRIVEAGVHLMQKAEDNTQLPLRCRAALYRNGLMLALLAVCPIRFKNFAALELGTSLRRMGARWIITLSASDAKSGRVDERIVPENLCPAIDLYLRAYRTPAREGETMLWVGRTGAPLGYSGVERSITWTAEMELSIALNPHLFRDCAASTVYWRNSGSRRRSPAAYRPTCHVAALQSCQDHQLRGRVRKIGRGRVSSLWANPCPTTTKN